MWSARSLSYRQSSPSTRCMLLPVPEVAAYRETTLPLYKSPSAGVQLRAGVKLALVDATANASAADAELLFVLAPGTGAVNISVGVLGGVVEIVLQVSASSAERKGGWETSEIGVWYMEPV